MNCCQCQGIEELFNEKSVAKELESYRVKGPSKTTRLMVEALKEEGITDYSLLDIGGGVGAVQHELLQAGVVSATDIDASQAYLNAASREAMRRGLSEKIRFQHGNFVEQASQIPDADIVTLDRVICCYHDMRRLVDLSAGKAKRLYAVVYPYDSWWIKIGVKIINFFMKLQKSSFRTFIHPTRAVEEIVRRHGLERAFYYRTLVWQVAVFKRNGSFAAGD